MFENKQMMTRERALVGVSGKGVEWERGGDKLNADR